MPIKLLSWVFQNNIIAPKKFCNSCTRDKKFTFWVPLPPHALMEVTFSAKFHPICGKCGPSKTKRPKLTCE